MATAATTELEKLPQKIQLGAYTSSAERVGGYERERGRAKAWTDGRTDGRAVGSSGGEIDGQLHQVCDTTASKRLHQPLVPKNESEAKLLQLAPLLHDKLLAMWGLSMNASSAHRSFLLCLIKDPADARSHWLAGFFHQRFPTFQPNFHPQHRASSFAFLPLIAGGGNK